MSTQTTSTFESSLKSKDTEDFIDLYFYRPIGYAWALLFRKIGVTPNQVSILSIFIGIAAGVCFYFTNWTINLIGVFLLIAANIYDNTDGQLARMTNKQSEFGRILNGVCSASWFCSIYIAIVCRLWSSYDWGILVLGITAGYFHIKQYALADYYRNIHLVFLRGQKSYELDSSKDLDENLNNINGWKNPFRKFCEWAYLQYTKGQEYWTPKTQQMFRVINTKYQGVAPDWFRGYYRKKSRKYLKYTNLLSFNLRSIVLFATILADCPWMYFIFELTIMNLLLIYTVRRYERMTNKFRGGLEHDSFDQ